MRILFTCRAAIGHFHPLVPLARAARDAGHEVAFGMAPVMRATVERLGFRWFAAGLDESSPEYARFLQERLLLPGRERAAFMRRGAVTLLGPRMATIGAPPTRRPRRAPLRVARSQRSAGPAP